jgi:YhcH/YjgK/YiaL family protein
MILAKIDDPNLRSLLPGEVWREALDWINEKSATADLGIHELRGDLMYVNVLSYETLPRENCRYESHREYIDLQFTIEGEEGIDYCNYKKLEKDGNYNSGLDLQFYSAAPQESTLRIDGKTFCIFFPEDAHRPKIKFTESKIIKKLVVKIHIKLLKDE